MTTSQLHRELADLTEKLEALETENAVLKDELQLLKTKVPATEKQWLRTDEAAKLIGRSPTFLHKDRMDHDATGGKKTPMIPFRKDGHRSVIYSRRDLEAFIEGRSGKGKKIPSSERRTA